MIALRGIEPIAQGNKRFIFLHPHDAGLLIKVWKPDIVKARWGEGRRWHKTLNRYGPYVSLQREMSEHLALAVRHPEGVPVLQKPAGIAETDFGLGVVVEKLTGRDGKLAPTLAALVRRDGITAPIRAKLDQFLAEMLHYGVVVGKLHEFNLVLADRGDGERFVMIDGYGEKAAIPIHAWSARINAAHTRRRFAVLLDKLPLAAAGQGRRSGLDSAGKIGGPAGDR